MGAVGPFNPLDRASLARSVADALLRSALHELDSDEIPLGAGIYAIYYTGSFVPYVPISNRNKEGEFGLPIYVGKAIPEGGRKGLKPTRTVASSALRSRLRKHRASIDQANNLSPADFRCRALVVDDIWIPLGESALIQEFRPLWNVVVDGFGNNDPGIRRATQFRSPWDELHPGRDFADKLPRNPTLSLEALIQRIQAFFAQISTKDGSE